MNQNKNFDKSSVNNSCSIMTMKDLLKQSNAGDRSFEKSASFKKNYESCNLMLIGLGYILFSAAFFNFANFSGYQLSTDTLSLLSLMLYAGIIYTSFFKKIVLKSKKIFCFYVLDFEYKLK